MRKNQVDRNGLKGLYTVFEIRGLNLDRFINTVIKRGIELFDVKKHGNKRLIVTVSYYKSQNFFAIAEELCYNIKKIRDKGKLYPLLQISRAIGLFVGAIIFIVSTFIISDRIFSFSFEGSGSIYKREMQEYLYSKGVVRYAKFSDFELSSLEDGLLADNSHLSFVSCIKKGNRLIINSVISTEKVKTLPIDVYALYSDTDGVVESIKAYRGTAVVGVGDTVKKGQLLVDGYAIVKEETVRINVLATVTLRVSETVCYKSNSDTDKDTAIAFTEELLGEKDYRSITAERKKDGDGYLYVVTAVYGKTIYTE